MYTSLIAKEEKGNVVNHTLALKTIIDIILKLHWPEQVIHAYVTL